MIWLTRTPPNPIRATGTLPGQGGTTEALSQAPSRSLERYKINLGFCSRPSLAFPCLLAGTN